MLKLRSTVHEVAWEFNNLAYSSGLMFGRVISTIVFRPLLCSNRWSKYYFIPFGSLSKSNTFTFAQCLIKVAVKSCNIKFLAPA